MCRVVNVNGRFAQFPVRCGERRHPRCKRGVVGYLDEGRRLGFRRVRDAGLHVG
jgi:hypothetical protein